MSSIAIIGTGHMGRALGHGWALAGERVVYGSREPGARRDLGSVAPGAAVRSYGEALAEGEVVVIAIPFSQVASFVQEHRDQLQGKIVVDITNPFDDLKDRNKAAAQITSELIGRRARVVAAFKDNFAGTLYREDRRDGERIQVRVAGDDDAAKAVVASLAEKLEADVLDCGSLANARFLDAMVSLMVFLDSAYADGHQRSGWIFASALCE